MKIEHNIIDFENNFNINNSTIFFKNFDDKTFSSTKSNKKSRHINLERRLIVNVFEKMKKTIILFLLLKNNDDFTKDFVAIDLEKFKIEMIASLEK